MYAIYSNYSYTNNIGWLISYDIPTFYVNADCEESAVKVAREILWASRDDKYAYHVSACAV
jgi:hypothetical protein